MCYAHTRRNLRLVRINVPALVAIREAGGDTRKTLAKRAGCSPQALDLIEKGETKTPRPTMVKALADALRVPVAAITLPDDEPAEAAS